MATDQASRRGKGNRRTGRVKGTPARRGQLPWREDPLVRRRIELVEELGYQPRAVLLASVNRWLEQQGELPISESTLKADLQRAQDLAFERITKGAEARIVDLERLKERAWRDVNRLKEGDPGRAAFYATIFRATVAQAHLDGSWRGGAAQPTPATPEIGMLGPSPLEMLEQGRITREQYEVYLAVFHRTTGGLITGGAVLEGEVVRQALPPAGPPPVVRPLATGGGRPPIAVTADGEMEELPEDERGPVVEWQPDEDQFP